MSEKMKVVKNALELIGNTPLLKLERVTKGLDVNVYVKCEYLNPSGSIKDKMALRMVEEAEKEGKLKPGGTIVESTGGNTGPALAFVGAVKGYKVRLYIPAEWTGTYTPTDRVNIMKFFGAEVETFDPNEYKDILNKIDEEYRTLASVCTGFKKCYDLDKGDPDIF
jgi:cystathionine beta-synthase